MASNYNLGYKTNVVRTISGQEVALPGTSTTDVMSQKAVTDELALKINKTSVKQTTGASTTDVMSQKAVTDELKKTAKKTVRKNIFNKDTDVIDGKYISTTTYTIRTTTDWGITDYLPVEAEEDYIITNPYYTTKVKAYFDKNMQHLGGDSDTQFTTPANCAFVVFTLYSSSTKSSFDGANVQLEKGTTATDVEPYIFTLTDDNGVAASVLKKSNLGKEITDDMLIYMDKYIIRDSNAPFNPDNKDVRNLISDLYKNEVAVDVDRAVGGSKMFSISSNSPTATLSRKWNEDLYLLGQKNVLRMYGSGMSGVSKYEPSMAVRIGLDDLKKIGIDITDASYTTKKVNIRLGRNNLVYMKLCYSISPNSIIGYSTNTVNPFYQLHADVNTASPSQTIIDANPSANLTIGLRKVISNSIDFRFADGVPIYKELVIGGSTTQFQGIVISFLRSSSSVETDVTRGYDIHSLAVCNDDDYTNIQPDTDLLNRPEDIITPNIINLSELKDTDISYPSQGQGLFFNEVTGKWENGDSENSNVVTIKNSDKIAFYGCSYTESYYAIKNKSWVNKLAQMTDWIVANFGVSGNRITDEVERLRANSNPYHSTIGIKELNPSVISFANIGNETLHNLDNLDMYRQEFLYALQHVKAVGAEMIVGTDHFATNAVETLLYGLGKELGILAAPIGTVGNQVLSNDYSGFWGGGHPATRTNAHTFLEWLYFVSQLPRPKKSVKVFRVKSELKAGSPSITDLSYDTIQQRIKIFQEINSGEISLKEADGVNGWEYYDRLDENFSGQGISNEYCKLIANEDVNFTDNALLELIIDKLNPDTLTINIAVDAEPDEIYIADNNAASTIYDEKKTGQAFKVSKTVYDSFASMSIDEAFTSAGTGANSLAFKGRAKGIHLGGYYLFFGSSINSVSAASGNLTRTSNSAIYAYESINSTIGSHQFPLFDNYEKPWSRFIAQEYTYADGVATIALTGDFKKLIQYDKVRLLVAKTGSFNISDINATYTGGVEKRQIANPKFELKSTGEELNSKTGFDSDWTTTGGWTNNGASLKQMPVDVRDYPPIHSDNNHIELGYDDTDGFSTSIEKTFTITPKTKGVTKVVVRAIARLFPKIFDTTKTPDDYHTNVRQIKADSFDMGTLVCKLNNGGTPSAILKKPVDIGWSEIYFETYIPATSVTDLIVELYRDEADKFDEVNYRNHLYPMQVYDVSVQVTD